ncbi:MAG TPA: primosomal protein N' [Gemmatimonadales bacterium]|nr:primosomal protein N' [Gemmatimonadales bacterium]
MTEPARSACAVALPLPVVQAYRYAIPPALADRVAPGMRVVVPVRTQEMVGIVLQAGMAADPSLRPILLVTDDAPLLSPALLALAQWTSRYYGAPTGLVLRAMLPAALWGRSRLVARLVDAGRAPGGVSRLVADALRALGGKSSVQRLAKTLQRPVWDAVQRLVRVGAVALDVIPPDLGPSPGAERTVKLTRALPSLVDRERAFARARRQRELYDTLDAIGGEADLRHLTRQLGYSAAVVRALVERGLAAYGVREALRDPFAREATPPPAELSEAQRRALDEFGGLPRGGAATLFGVTGSGKTLVYLEMLRPEVSRGGGAILLVPEISLTPQTVARVRGVFGDHVAVLHSALSDAERADAWRAIAAGRKSVVVGARSAVFAPVPHLAAIVVDEEHDASYKNGETPRYHARDIALTRARIEGARVVLGSATPSLESWSARDRIAVIELPERVAASELPAVRLVDLRTAQRVAESGPVPWSQELDEAIERRLARGEQGMVLLNRRGFAQFVQCSACGEVIQCPACSISLTLHRVPEALRCHYCGHREAIPQRCPKCGQATTRTHGVGTQALERWLAQRYPRARLARMDADTTSARWSHRRILAAFARGEIDLLVGTQMIAKGLDFPRVTVVGVVDADTALHLPDFRAAERTFQLIAQVAGRAGRGPAGGEVIVQTRRPDHYALRAAAAHDYRSFAATELETRRSPPYPPHVGLVNVIVSGPAEDAVSRSAGETADWLSGLIATRAPGAVTVIGPAPAPLARVKRRWRWHVLLKAEERRWLGRIVRYAAARLPVARRGTVRVTFDRDPVSLL